MKYKKGSIIDDLSSGKKIRIEQSAKTNGGNPNKYWVQGMFVCDEMAKSFNGRKCNGCANRCGDKPLFIKVYEGQEETQIIEGMKNQGEIQIVSPYIAKTYGTIQEQDSICVVMEYVDGKNLNVFCRTLENIINETTGKCLSGREQLLIKYRLMRQMLYAVRDYQRFRQEHGDGVHLDLKPEHFLVYKGYDWNDFSIKLIDFESFINEGQDLKVFQMTSYYAHPEQIACFQQLKSSIQVRANWDYYALALVFFEMLEEKTFYSEKEVQARYEAPEDVKKEICLKKHSADMQEKEQEQLTALLEKMISLDNPYRKVRDILEAFQNFLDTWVEESEIELLKGSEFLKMTEQELVYAPYVQVGFNVKVKNHTSFYQYFEVMQGGIVPLVCGANLPASDKKYVGKTLGYLYESNGNVKFLWLQGEHILELEKGCSIPLPEGSLSVCRIQNMGCAVKYTEESTEVIEEEQSGIDLI